MKYKVEPIITALNEIISGLHMYNLLAIMKEKRAIFKSVFCPSQIFAWKYKEFVDIICPNFSEEGSNSKQNEIETYKFFLDFVELCFKDGKCIIIYSNIVRSLQNNFCILTKFLKTK